MGEILKQIGMFLLNALKAMDWKSVMYKLCHGTILPAIKAKVDKTDSKIDDVIYEGLARLVDSFLAPIPSSPKAVAVMGLVK